MCSLTAGLYVRQGAAGARRGVGAVDRINQMNRAIKDIFDTPHESCYDALETMNHAH